MTSPKRYTLITAGIIVFALAVPGLILGIQGYIYDFTAGQIVKTGILVARTDPRGAVITVANENQIKERRAPATIRFLRPGDYTVTIEHPDYHSWQKRMNIRGGIVTWVSSGIARKILVPKNPKLTREAPILDESQIRQPAPMFTYDFTPSQEKSGMLNLVRFPSADPANSIIIVVGIPERQNYEIINTPSGLIFILLDKTLYQVNDGLEYLADGVAIAKWNNDAVKLVYGNAHELSFYNPHDPGPGQRELIIRTSEAGGSFCVMPDFGYVLRVYENTVRAIELDGRDRRNIYELLQFENEPEIIECASSGRNVIIRDGEIYQTYNLRR